ncbi:hypothetical protein Hanom_Chr02g00147641 [Helianthus anomalus]
MTYTRLIVRENVINPRIRELFHSNVENSQNTDENVEISQIKTSVETVKHKDVILGHWLCFWRRFNQSYISESVWLSAVDRGEEEVMSVPRCDDGGVRLVLPDLKQVFVDEVEPSYMAQSYPQHKYRTYNLHTENQHKLDYEEGAKDFEENDNEVKEGVILFEKRDHDDEEDVAAAKVLTTKMLTTKVLMTRKQQKTV